MNALLRALHKRSDNKKSVNLDLCKGGVMYYDCIKARRFSAVIFKPIKT